MTVTRWTPPEQPHPGPGRQVVITGMQAAVLDALCHGATLITIARHHGVTENTIKTHAKRLFDRLGAFNQAHAVALAHAHPPLIDNRRNQWAPAPAATSAPASTPPTARASYTRPPRNSTRSNA